MNSKNIEPFVKWIGGKRQLLPQLLKRIPIKFSTYIEPFIGGGALFFAIQPKKAIINDINKELINAYKVIKNKHKLLVEFLQIMEIHHDYKFFYSIRKMDRTQNFSFPFKPSNQLKAARFIYLNKTCFNGMYRVNKSNQFNVPNGKKSKKCSIYNYYNLENISYFIKNNDIKILSQSFEKICKQAKKGDFVYLDPPYDYEVGQKNGFDSYSKNSFAQKGQHLLAKVCYKLHSKEVKFMVSNHNTVLIQKLYKDFKIEVIKAKRLIGGKNASRKDVEEVLIRNYE